MPDLTRFKALLAALAIGAVTVTAAGCGGDNNENDDLGDQIEKSADDAGNAIDETADDAADGLDGKDEGKEQPSKP